LKAELHDDPQEERHQQQHRGAFEVNLPGWGDDEDVARDAWVEEPHNHQHNQQQDTEFEVDMTGWDDNDEKVDVLNASSSAQPNVPAINDLTSMSKRPSVR